MSVVASIGMEQKAADQLAGVERHRFDHAVLAIILPGAADLAVFEREQPAVGDGDAMGIAAEIGERLTRAVERRLSILPIITEIGSRSATLTIRCIGRRALFCAWKIQKGNAIFA